jgi:hypothetical protein
MLLPRTTDLLTGGFRYDRDGVVVQIVIDKPGA